MIALVASMIAAPPAAGRATERVTSWTFHAFNQLQGEAGLSITDPRFSRAD